MVDTVFTKKFSEFTSGGDLENTDITVGLRGATNTQFNNPWTFLAPGSTGDRPVPNPSMFYRLRFNTTLEFYEYYDPTIPIWVELSGSGTGTVNPGVVNDLAFYAASGQAVSPIASAPNSVLVTSPASVPSLSTTLPANLTIPNATITNSSASLTFGSILAAPVAGTDITNKTYVDNLFNSGVISATGTVNQVFVNASVGIPKTGAITLSLPQDIALGSTPTFGGMTLTTIPLGVSSGGSGLSSLNTYRILAGGTTSTGALQQIASGATGTILQSQGAGALASYTTATYPSTVSANNILYASGANVVGQLTPGTGVISALGQNITGSGGIVLLNAPTLTGTATFGSIAFTNYATGGIIGTPTNNQASTGYVGEVVAASVIFGSSVALTTNTNTDILSISLTAGDWNLWGNVGFTMAATTNVTALTGWLTQTSATIPDASLRSRLSFGAAGLVPGGPNNIIAFVLPSFRLTLSATTTVYLDVNAVFTIDTCNAFGRLVARRLR